MTPLPIREMVLYKHGVGYFVRAGTVSGKYPGDGAPTVASVWEQKLGGFGGQGERQRSGGGRGRGTRS